VLQCVLTPLKLYESELFQIHLLGRKVRRPFPVANPFGLPQTSGSKPEAEPEPEPKAKALGGKKKEERCDEANTTSQNPAAQESKKKK